MNLYNVFGGLESDQYNLHHTQEKFEDPSQALKYAREYIEELYMQNPKRDILEIMEQDKVSEDVARIQFKLEMYRSVIYFVEEIIEINGEVVEVIKHGAW